MDKTNFAKFNPKGLPEAELPVIYGFNNGGGAGWMEGVLVAENGHYLGGHVCSSEGWMLNDLGIVEGARPDRHEKFREHFPDGYRMDFVPYAEVKKHAALMEAIEKASAKPQDSDQAPRIEVTVSA